MALVTTCPRCGTHFRVVVDQLKLHGGRVRCSACLTVFSALDSLRALPAPGAPASGAALPLDGREPPPAGRTPTIESAARAAERREEDVQARDFGPEDYAPWRGERDAAGVRREPRLAADFAGAPAGGRPAAGDIGPGEAGSRPAMLQWALAGLLLALLAWQTIVAGRDRLAARLPALEPVVAAAAAPFGLRIDLPRSLGSLSISSFELRAAGEGGLFSASAVLRNDADHAVRWPSMQLSLVDADQNLLARKTIDPQDYLEAASDAPLRARSERTVRFALQADDLAPAGYSVVLFYR